MHEISDRAEKEVNQKMGVFLVIHMDPIAVHDARIMHMREQVQAVIDSIDPPVSMHDFRVVDGEKTINLIFDVAISFDYDRSVQLKVFQDIRSGICALDSRYNPVITLEHEM